MLEPRNEGASVLDVTNILTTGWKQILLITSLIVILSVVLALYFSKYKSEGFFQFGGPIPGSPVTAKDRTVKEEERTGIALSDYKRYAAAFGTAERFSEFVQQNQLQNLPGVEKLTKVFASREGIGRFIEPVFPFTKLDAKELMDQPKDVGNNLIGLKISFDGETPTNAKQIVGLLGRYTIDTIIYLVFTDALRFKHSEINAKITKLDNTIIENKVKLEELKRKKEALSSIVSRYPSEKKDNANQVVTVTEENARFLPPVTHLMSTEVQASEIAQLILKAQREQTQNLLLREYYDQVNVFIDKTKSGEAILRGMEPIKEAIFKGKNLEDETVKQVYNLITIDNQAGLSLYLEKSRFIAGPSLPTNRSARLSQVIFISALGGFGLSLLVLFGRRIRPK